MVFHYGFLEDVEMFFVELWLKSGMTDDFNSYNH